MFDLSKPELWGPQAHGAELFINDFEALKLAARGKAYMAVDCETDEQDNFVGLAVCFDTSKVFYFSEFPDAYLQSLFQAKKLIGHNIKADLTWLKRWGIEFNLDNVCFDTMLASYVINPTKDTHGLKRTAEQRLGWSWPSYDEMVDRLVVETVTKGKRHPKTVVKEVLRHITLDRAPVVQVANYCGMDCLATMALFHVYNACLTPIQRRILLKLEIPISRILFRMERRGILIDVEYLAELDQEFSAELIQIKERIQALAKPEVDDLLKQVKITDMKTEWQRSGYKGLQKGFNPGSWQQKRLLLTCMGFDIETTDKKELRAHKAHPLVSAFLDHSEVSKLKNAFIGNDQKKTGIKYIPTLPLVHAEFGQCTAKEKGLTTGRLSSRSPNLMQIPARTTRGKKLRKLFIARPGNAMIVADYSQADLRILAHHSKEPKFVNAFKTGKDIHQATADAMRLGRREGKECNLAVVNGVMEWTLAETLGVSVARAKEFLDIFWGTHPVLAEWKAKTLFECRRDGGVRNFMGWFIPVPEINSGDRKMRSYAERFAINSIAQGGTAALVKNAMIATVTAGYEPLLQIHDELIFDLPAEGAASDMAKIKDLMKTAVTLEVPLEVEIGMGRSWGEAKP
jgi:DNA polymerase I